MLGAMFAVTFTKWHFPLLLAFLASIIVVILDRHDH